MQTTYFTYHEMEYIIENLKKEEWANISSLIVEKIKSKAPSISAKRLDEISNLLLGSSLDYDVLKYLTRNELEKEFNIAVKTWIDIYVSDSGSAGKASVIPIVQ